MAIHGTLEQSVAIIGTPVDLNINLDSLELRITELENSINSNQDVLLTELIAVVKQMQNTVLRLASERLRG